MRIWSKLRVQRIQPLLPRLPHRPQIQLLTTCVTLNLMAASVCIIGAGISGLVTAKVLSDDGFHVTIFDSAPELGGVWASFRAYPGLRANNTKFSYNFSDLPYPASADEYPTAQQVRDYLNLYAGKFALRPHLYLSTRVTFVDRAPSGSGFTLTTNYAGQSTTHHFDFVAVCNGVFSRPNLPTIKNSHLFSGPILHSSYLRDFSQLSAKRVLVIGSAKSGLDCAALASQHAAQTTLLFRRAHWMIARHLPNGKPGESFFFNRFAGAFAPYHRSSPRNRFLHTRLAPLVRAWWALQGKLLRSSVGYPPSMQPTEPLPAGLSFAGVGTDFFDAVHAGRITPQRGSISNILGPTTVEYTSPDGTTSRLEADVIILATGYRQSIDFLAPSLARLVLPAKKFRLYRHILPPSIPGLGFIGYASSTTCQLTSEIAAHWLSDCFLGNLALPSPAAMESEIDRVQAWLSSTIPGRDQGYFIGGFVPPYLDELMRDMRLNPHRLSGFFSHYFSQLLPEHWAGIATERRARPTP